MLREGGTARIDKNYEDSTSLLKAADILVTGVWEGCPDHIRLTIKALEIEKRGTVEIASAASKISKRNFPKEFLECLHAEVQTELKESAETGGISIVAISKGSSNETDMLIRRISAQKKALKTIRQKLISLLTQKYGFSKEEAASIYDSGEIAGAECFSDAKEVEIQYKIFFQKNRH